MFKISLSRIKLGYYLLLIRNRINSKHKKEEPESVRINLMIVKEEQKEREKERKKNICALHTHHFTRKCFVDYRYFTHLHTIICQFHENLFHSKKKKKEKKNTWNLSICVLVCVIRLISILMLRKINSTLSSSWMKKKLNWFAVIVVTCAHIVLNGK